MFALCTATVNLIHSEHRILHTVHFNSLVNVAEPVAPLKATNSIKATERPIRVKLPMSDVPISRRKNPMSDLDVYLFTSIRTQG